MPGHANTVADALSRVPEDSFADKKKWHPYEAWAPMVAATLRISTDTAVLKTIQEGYKHDPFCQWLIASPTNIPSTKEANSLWHIGHRLLILHYGDIHENLFRLAHDTIGHFGFNKSYTMLRDEYYWPNMHRDLENAYIPACTKCQ